MPRKRKQSAVFDVVAVGPVDVRLVQVKAPGPTSRRLEQEQIRALVVSPNVSREAWRFPNRARAPIIERLS